MPVEIPRVKRINPVDEPSVGRVEVKAPDITHGMEKYSKQSEQLVGAVGEYVRRVERDAADTEANKREFEWEKFATSKLEDAKRQEGNPTELYKSLDEELEKEYDRMTSEKLSGYTKEVVQKRLNNSMQRFQLRRLSEYGSQQAKYDNNIFTDGVKLKKRDLPNTVAYISPDDPSTFAPADNLIGEITNMHLRRGMKYGSVTPNEQGTHFYIDEDGKPIKVAAGPGVQLELAKDLSEGVTGMIENATNTGQTEIARALQERYGKFIDAAKAKSIDDSLDKAELNHTARLVSISNPKEQQKILNSIKDPVRRSEIQDKARSIVNDRQRHNEEIVNRSSKQYYNDLAKHVMNGDYTTLTQLQSDPYYINMIGKIKNPKQVMAIEEMVVQPKNSRTESMAKVNDLFFSGQAKGMSTEDFTEQLTGLSKGDRSKAMTRYQNLHTETGAQESAKLKRAGDEFKKQALAMNLLREDDFNRVSGKEFDRMVGMQNQLMEHVESLGPNPSQKEVNEIVKEFTLAQAKGRAFKAPAKPSSLVGSPKTPKTDKNQAGYRSLDTIERGKSRRDWKKDLKDKLKREPTLIELNNYIDEQ
jgi:hypothetical protein